MSGTSQAINAAERERRAHREPRALHPETVGDLLRRYRIAAGLTQEELAERAALSVRAVGDIERGAKQRPHRETLRLLADALDLADDERDRFFALARSQRSAVAALAPVLSAPSNLPAQVTPLVGRADVVRAAATMIRSASVRLLTITGTGGVGKTRLAIAVADELRAEMPDGVLFVPLAAVRDPALVPYAVAQALDVRERAEESLDAAIFGTIGQKRLLLVLDNFEHLPAAAPFVGAALAACPRLVVLATSRVPLRVYGEHEFPLEPLAVPLARESPDIAALARVPAVDLFIQRARAIRPDFRLTPGTADAVADICRRLDGLPLALELAAARTRLLAPAELLARLDHRLHLLTTGPADRPPRQQTMRDAIAWSHDLLDEDERRLFRRLTVFGGGWTMRAVEAVCADDDLPAAAILDSAENLLEHHLLRAETASAEDETRIGIYETIREYACEQLVASGERAMTERRHAAYYLALAKRAQPELDGREQAMWVSRLESEHDNLRVALDWALTQAETEIGLRLVAAVWWFWQAHGHLFEAKQWFARMFALDRETGFTAPPATRARALLGAGMVAFRLYEHEQAAALLGESLALFQALADAYGTADALNALGLVAQEQGDFLRAAALYEESIALYRVSDSTYDIAIALARLQGEYARATTLFEESLGLQRAVENEWGIALALAHLAMTAQSEGNDERALFLHEESLMLRRKVGDKQGIAASLSLLAAIARKRGDYDGAIAMLEEGLPLARETGEQRLIASILNRLGDVAYTQAAYDRAIVRYREALPLFTALGFALSIAQTIERLACVAAAIGHATHGARLWGAATAIREDTQTPLTPADHLFYASAITAARGALGEVGFAAAWKAGKTLAREDAIAEAFAGMSDEQ